MRQIRPPYANYRNPDLYPRTTAYWRGAVEFDFLNKGQFISGPAAATVDGVFTAGVISFWLHWEPPAERSQGWPVIAQGGPFDLSSYFGSDPIFNPFGCVEVQVVPLPSVGAVEFAPGAT